MYTSSFFGTIKKLEYSLKEKQKEIDEVDLRNHELEVENEKLKAELKGSVNDGK